MSKFICKCSHIISDKSDNLPYKAAVIRDQVEENFFEDVVAEVSSIINDSFQADNWVKNIPVGNAWDPKPKDIFYDHLSGIYLNYFSTIFECEKCGRIWIQEKGKQTFKSYTPESGEYEGILNEHNNA